MKLPEPRFRCLLVAWLMISWLTATNHCALGLMRSPAEHAQCHACHPAQQKMPRGDWRECCRDIQGVLASAPVDIRHDESVYVLARWMILELSGQEAAGREVEVAYDHGPPRANSFAEAVLQRSLCSHAPPYAA